MTDLTEAQAKRCYLFRYGGEEFILFVEDPTDEEIVSLGLAVCRAVWDAAIERHDHCLYERITVTVGCAAEFVQKGVIVDYIRNADTQLYVGKGAQKNCVVWQNKIYRLDGEKTN